MCHFGTGGSLFGLACQQVCRIPLKLVCGLCVCSERGWFDAGRGGLLVDPDGVRSTRRSLFVVAGLLPAFLVLIFCLPSAAAGDPLAPRAN